MREIVLEIPLTGLLIYYADGEIGWRRSVINFFIEVDKHGETTLHRYQLNRIDWVARPPAKGREYRFLVHLKEGQDLSTVKTAIKAGGYRTTKVDYDPESERLRIWFVDPQKPMRGEETEARNIWT